MADLLPSSAAARLTGLTPAEVAGSLRHLGGLVFFDSALEQPRHGPVRSIISAAPVEIITGQLARDWERLESAVGAAGPQRFAAGAVGYEGEFEFGLYDQVLIFEHATGAWHGWGSLAEQLRDAPGGTGLRGTLDFQPQTSREAYCQAVARAQEYIASGDIYQVNLAHRWESSWQGDAWELYQQIRASSPAPHAAYLQMQRQTVLSTSPELFLQMRGRQIRTRPIKGTRPRKADPQADEKSSFDLLTSPKEIAELVMITDLERNDLGQVCEWGSVEVRELLAMERFAQVFHLVSTVEGRLRPEVEHTAAFRACFPGGSITGAPKKRAREIIAELEPSPRGLYTGAIGWFGLEGESQFNIAIRTLITSGGTAHFHTGAGIVADSLPEREWQETLDKAAGLLLAARRWNEALA